MKISVNQIRDDELSARIIAVTSGSAFSGNLESYTAANGYLGSNVVYASGGPQTVNGLKSFTTNPGGIYTGGTGNFVIYKRVTDLITGSIESFSGFLPPNYVSTTGSNTISGDKTFISPITVPQATNTGHAIRLIDLQIASGILSTGLNNIVVPNSVYQTGNQLISGQKTFVSSPAVPTTPTNVTGAINLLYLSGVSGILAGQGGTPNSVTTTGNEVIGGFKQFTGSPFVPAPTQPSGAVNLSYLSGVSGVLAVLGGGGSPNSVTTTGNYIILGQLQFSGSPLVPVPTQYSGASNLHHVTGISGFLYDFITGRPSGDTVIIDSGTYNNTIITGNFTNVSFFFDEYSFITGRNLSEVFIGRSFFFTGYGLGLINSGYAGTTSGSFYQRTLTNTKTVFANFEINSGLLSYVSGGFLQPISGMNRVGVDILSKGSGATGFCIGLFGGES